ncbi:hypothetical protein ACLSZW_02270 [Avibacterium avium]|uniref:hypothetical protein n=1 Tax=Avibacterium avium TaxID=751 RepID=UPI003BF7F762
MLSIRIYFKEANSNAETDDFIKKFSPFMQRELEDFYQHCDYKFSVYSEKYIEGKVPIDTLIIIFDLNESLVGNCLLTEMRDDTLQYGENIIKYMYSLLREFTKHHKK